MRRTLFCLTIIGLAAIFAAGCPKKQTTPIEESVTAEDGSGTGSAAGGAGATRPIEEMPAQQEPFAEEPLSEGSGSDAAGSGRAGALPLETVYFEYDSDELSPDVLAVLERNAAWMRANAGTRVLVEGNTDERGTLEYNLSLGARRANAVRNQLIRLGIPAAQLETISFGEDQPADAGHDDAAWAKNRRCDFTEAQ